ncbi:MAG: hypothetical protein HY816_19460 [Candidatus Wallbacteria bacterium]|nr:hypothetical protein [Candidatus Wallbacteria bacterium]
MPNCASCGRALHLPATGNVVTCTGCWRTNFVNRDAGAQLFGLGSGVPAGAICGGCHRPLEPVPPMARNCDSCHRFTHDECWSEAAGRCASCARQGEQEAGRPPGAGSPELGEAFAALGGLARAVARYGSWVLWQAALVWCAIFAGMWLGAELAAQLAGRISEPERLAGYLRWTPHAVGAAVYIALLELSLLLYDWNQRIGRSGQGPPTVFLMLWHRALLGPWRAATLALAGAAAAAILAGGLRHHPQEAAPFGFLALLVFLLLGFTRVSRVLYAAALVGGLGAAGYCLLGTGGSAPLDVDLGFHRLRLLPEELLGPALATVALSMLLLYAEALAARKYGLCRRCSGYVRRDGETCPECGLSWRGGAASPPFSARNRRGAPPEE